MRFSWLPVSRPLKRSVLAFPLVLGLLMLGPLGRTSAESAAKAPEWSLRWSFDELDQDQRVGRAKLAPVGPTAEDFVGLPTKNSALVLQGKGDYVRIPDDGTQKLAFDLGDSITLEAWVRTDKVNRGQNVYIVGKGRTYRDGKRDNQNYALRLTGTGSGAGIGFLFRSVPGEDAPSDWHRWTSKAVLPVDGDWHHVAIAYTFGKPNSIRGYIDGNLTGGTWDMGGATVRGPIVDDDELWIGSSMGGSAGNSFAGAIDEVVIHRQIVAAEELANRRIAIEQPPEFLNQELTPDQITVTLHEHAGSHAAWPRRLAEPTTLFHQPTFAFAQLPQPYGLGGVRRDWNAPLVLMASAMIDLPAGEIEWMLRTGGLSRLWMDEEVVARTPPHLGNTSGHGKVIPYEPNDPWLRPPHAGHHEEIFTHTRASAGPTRVTLQTMIGGDNLRPTAGEIILAYRVSAAEPWRVLSFTDAFSLTDYDWHRYLGEHQSLIMAVDDRNRRQAAAGEDDYWADRHQRAHAYVASLPPLEHDGIDDFLDTKIDAVGVSVSPTIDDEAFLRRLYLDCTGVVPTVAEIEQLRSSSFTSAGGDHRAAWIDHVLQDPRFADHWTVYWMDVLAENPNILKASLNNTGPFRWYLYDMMRDNVGVDRWVTNLIRMEGSELYGGPAGFGLAAQNDVPMAAKAHILSSALLGVNMKCARCHDAPYHDWTQEDLFSIASMLANQPLAVPATSSVPDEFFAGESPGQSLITITLKPGEKVAAQWPLETWPIDDIEAVLGRPDSPRERVAYHFTRPENEQFAKTIVNRLWGRLFGEAIVQPVDDWEGARPSHGELLEFLGRELTAHGYDFKHVTRLILNSRAYQRSAVDRSITRDEKQRYFDAPLRRRMSAEQMVDSMHVAVGVAINSDELTFDPEARMRPTAMNSLGRPQRAWQFTSLSNERDRPALMLPRASAVCECLEAFGWTGARQEPINHRDDEPNVLQPAILASGLLSIQLTRLTDESELTSICVDAESPAALVDHLFQRFLSRVPTEAEQAKFVPFLREGFDTRVLETPAPPETPLREPLVSWANHLSPEASDVRLRELDALRDGPPPTGRLNTQWRHRAEDVVWALINTPEFQFLP